MNVFTCSPKRPAEGIYKNEAMHIAKREPHIIYYIASILITYIITGIKESHGLTNFPSSSITFGEIFCQVSLCKMSLSFALNLYGVFAYLFMPYHLLFPLKVSLLKTCLVETVPQTHIAEQDRPRSFLMLCNSHSKFRFDNSVHLV